MIESEMKNIEEKLRYIEKTILIFLKETPPKMSIISPSDQFPIFLFSQFRTQYLFLPVI